MHKGCDQVKKEREKGAAGKRSVRASYTHCYGYTRDSRLSAALAVPPGNVVVFLEDCMAFSSSWVPTRLKMAL